MIGPAGDGESDPHQDSQRIAAKPDIAPARGHHPEQMSALAESPAILSLLRSGSRESVDALVPLLYQELRAIAHRQIARRPNAATLDTTGLVHEAYLKVVDHSRAQAYDHAHFLALASEIMRNLLVDRARARLTAKRGSGVRPVELQDFAEFSDENLDSFADLDDSLTRLAQLSPRQGRLLQYRYFGGLTLEESAAAEGISLATAKRELRSARAWLALDLKGYSLR